MTRKYTKRPPPPSPPPRPTTRQSAVLKILLRVYDQDSDNGAKDLLRLYEREKKDKYLKEEFCAELSHRTALFFFAGKVDERLKVHDAIAGFIVDCYKKHHDADVLGCVQRAIEQYDEDPRSPDPIATLPFVSKVLSHSLITDTPGESNIPTVIDQEVFKQLYTHIAKHGLIKNEEIAAKVISAVKPFQDKAINKHFEIDLQAKTIIYTGFARPSPETRQISVEALCPSDKVEILMVFRMLEDPALDVRHAAAQKLIDGKLIGEIPRDLIIGLLKKSDLFISDDNSSPMYTLLFKIADEAYSLLHPSLRDSDDPDSPETFSKQLKSFLYMQITYRIANDMLPVMPFAFDYLLEKYGIEATRFLDIYIACWPNAIQMPSYKFVLIRNDPSPRVIHEMMLLVTTWLSLIQYACAPDQPMRNLAETMLLPDLRDFARFFVDFWKHLGKWAKRLAGMADIGMLLNAMAFHVFEISKYLPRHDSDTAFWRKAIVAALADTSFSAGLKVIVPMVREWMEKHLNVKDKPLHALLTVGAFLRRLIASQEQQARAIFEVSDDELPNMPKDRLFRITHILTAVLSSGYFTTQPQLVVKPYEFIFKVLNHLPSTEISLDFASVLTSSLQLCPPERSIHALRAILDKPEPFAPCFLDGLAYGIRILGLSKVNRIYFSDGYQLPGHLSSPNSPRCVTSLLLRLLYHDDDQIVLKACSVIMDLILFDIKHDQFRYAGAKFLCYAFKKSQPFEKKQFARRFWLQFSTISKDNQCRLSQYFVDVLRQDGIDTDLDYTGMATFVVNATTFDVLSKDALNRFGTAHYTLIQELLNFILSDPKKTHHHSLISKVLDRCEYSNAVELELLDGLIAKAKRIMEAVKPMKRISTIIFHRLNLVRRYIEFNGQVTITTEVNNLENRLHLLLLCTAMNPGGQTFNDATSNVSRLDGDSNTSTLTDRLPDASNEANSISNGYDETANEDATSTTNQTNTDATTITQEDSNPSNADNSTSTDGQKAQTSKTAHTRLFNNRNLTFTDLWTSYGRPFGEATDDEFDDIEETLDASAPQIKGKSKKLDVTYVEATACMRSAKQKGKNAPNA
uniref:MIF4G domain-containing protein n=1 Tax=Panagrellus redivivus TaxID=6233 RepID=A0A7E4V2J4_PANRE